MQTNWIKNTLTSVRVVEYIYNYIFYSMYSRSNYEIKKIVVYTNSKLQNETTTKQTNKQQQTKKSEEQKGKYAQIISPAPSTETIITKGCCTSCNTFDQASLRMDGRCGYCSAVECTGRSHKCRRGTGTDVNGTEN